MNQYYEQRYLEKIGNARSRLEPRRVQRHHKVHLLKFYTSFTQLLQSTPCSRFLSDFHARRRRRAADARCRTHPQHLQTLKLGINTHLTPCNLSFVFIHFLFLSTRLICMQCGIFLAACKQ
jgi:hypothetical protein